MGRHRTAILASCLAALALALLGGAILLRGYLRALQEERGALKRQQADLTASTATLMARKKDLSEALEELGKIAVAPAPSEMAFYSAVQQAPKDNGVDLLSIHWARPRQQEEGARAIVMLLRGDYPKVVHVLADWRKLPMALKMTALRLRRGEAGRVEAEAALEGLISNPIK